MTEPIDTWATTPGARKLLAEARRRIEAGSELARGALRVELLGSERRDVGSLLGVAWEASGNPPSVTALRRALEARGTSLRALLERDAPLRDLRAERHAARTAADLELADAVAALTTIGVAGPLAHAVLTRRGVVRPGTGRLRPFAADIARVLGQVPGPHGTPTRLAVLANALFADPHALDRSAPLGRAVARLAFNFTASPDALEYGDVTSIAEWRAAWLNLGVICDAVSSIVLTLNLALIGDAPAVAMTALSGEPVWLTLRSLQGRWTVPPCDVWVCENPSIVEAAADQLGTACRPLICTYGQPSTAALELVRAIDAGGGRLHVSADDDPAGQSIVAQLLNAAPHAELWRYRQRTARAATANPTYEEGILDDLVADLT